MCSFRSIRPGRSTAASIWSGLLVAATKTRACERSSKAAGKPSNSVKNWEITRSLTPPLPRWPHMPSSSSMNTTHGDEARARVKISRTAFSLSPTHFEKTYGPLIEIKFMWLSCANALASIVLLHPGGPYSNTPFGGLRWNLAKSACYVPNDHWTTCRKTAFASSLPPMSSQLTYGIAISNWRSELGWFSAAECTSSLNVNAIVPLLLKAANIVRSMSWRRSRWVKPWVRSATSRKVHDGNFDNNYLSSVQFPFVTSLFYKVLSSTSGAWCYWGKHYYFRWC